MNPIEILERSINEFKSQNVKFHLTYMKKLNNTRLKTQALRDQITSLSDELINKINQQTNLLLDKVDRIEKDYESILSQFLNKQREIEFIIEKNKFYSNECISNLNEAKSDLNLSQMHLEELKFVFEFEPNSQRPVNNLIGLIKV
jgi:hypothetical protein